MIGLLSVKKGEYSPTMNGKFCKDIQKMVSGFKFTAVQFDIKNPVDVKFDISCLSDDGKTREVTVQRIYDVQKDVKKLKLRFHYLMVLLKS